MTAREYLAPVYEAASLLGAKVYPIDVEQLAAVLDRLSPQGFPGDVISRLEALQLLTGSHNRGDVEELEILNSVWPDYSGSVRYKLTASTLTWQWSSKHTGRYATISVPFPTILPLTFTVERWTDMDDQNNHCDECPQGFPDDSDEYSDSCHCEAEIEQTVTLTIAEWDSDSARIVGDWLARAVDGPVEEVRL